MEKEDCFHLSVMERWHVNAVSTFTFIERSMIATTEKQITGPIIRLHPSDNVVVARVNVGIGTQVPSERFVCRSQVPAGHKIAARDLVAGDTVRAEELAFLAVPYAVDNLEGIYATRGPRGETLLWLLSDNNFNRAQRTILLLFELR